MASPTRRYAFKTSCSVPCAPKGITITPDVASAVAPDASEPPTRCNAVGWTMRGMSVSARRSARRLVMTHSHRARRAV
eukprot:31257-Pelagococcus_subviridis.AAC.6